ncbi:MAG: hypothetical protein A3H36_07025 [Chloroflexi bacterium RIFCSPLOWO2_02_FULL_71_16]|nr:MAG: hypothetical protein A3H36_07025 [Chloroflexi bacterium RIFCSPLOWO2_02_FULL_71_16]
MSRRISPPTSPATMFPGSVAVATSAAYRRTSRSKLICTTWCAPLVTRRTSPPATAHEYTSAVPWSDPRKCRRSPRAGHTGGIV